MDITILPHQLAKKAVKEYPGKLNIICCDRTERVKKEECKNLLELDMDDIQDWHIERWDRDLKAKGILYPERKHIVEAIKFDKQCNHKIHVIYCHAGISRSPAIAYAVLRGRGKSKNDAMREVMRIQPRADPNKRIIRLTDEMFG